MFLIHFHAHSPEQQQKIYWNASVFKVRIKIETNLRNTPKTNVAVFIFFMAELLCELILLSIVLAVLFSGPKLLNTICITFMHYTRVPFG